MASLGVVPTSGLREPNGHVGVDRLPEEMNDMKISDDKEMEAAIVDGNGTETGHIIVTTIGGHNAMCFYNELFSSFPVLPIVARFLFEM